MLPDGQGCQLYQGLNADVLRSQIFANLDDTFVIDEHAFGAIC
jgi:hypothetical protein